MDDGGDEVGCQECGSWSALLCVLCEMNRPTAGWGSHSQLTFVFRKPEGPGLPCLKSDTPMMKAAGPTS